MIFDNIISIGGNCDAAHHIRRHFDIKQSMPMDWLVVPYQALLSIFEDRFSDFIRLDRLALWNGTRHAILCSKRGTVFHHDFRRDQSALVEIDHVAIDFPEVARKYRRRISRLREACGPGRSVLFVRSWRDILHAPKDYPTHLIPGVPEYDFNRLLDLIGYCFPGLSFKVLFINYGPQITDDERALFANIRDCGDISDWTGSAAGWDEAFKNIDVIWRGKDQDASLEI